MPDSTDELRPSFVADLDRLIATHSRGTGTVSRLNHFAARLAAVDPGSPASPISIAVSTSRPT